MEDWLCSTSEWVDSTPTWKYVVPVSDPCDRERLRPIVAALVAAQVWQVLVTANPGQEARSGELRAEAMSLLVFHPGGVGTWLDGGMGAVLRRASEAAAYTLTDGATFTAYREHVKLQMLHRGSAGLANPYSILVIAPGKRAGAGVEDARRFSDFLTGPEGQGLITRFGEARHRQPLFQPAAGASR